jgi:hypothetical protein
MTYEGLRKWGGLPKAKSKTSHSTSCDATILSLTDFLADAQ